MKKIFTIINIVCICLAISLVSFQFLHGLETGKEIYLKVNNFSNSQASDSLIYDLEKTAILTETALSSSALSHDQISYLYELTTVVEKLDEFNENLSYYLLFDNDKTLQTAKIASNISSLEKQRNDLIFEIEIYTEKMSGTLYGDPEGTYNIFVKNLLNYISSYSYNFSKLTSYVKDNLNVKDVTKIYIFEIYHDAVINLYENYNNINFSNDSFLIIKQLNSGIKLENNNIKTNSEIVGGVYSDVAYQFNKNYQNSSNLASRYYELSQKQINLSNETDSTVLAFYYLDLLLNGGV